MREARQRPIVTKSRGILDGIPAVVGVADIVTARAVRGDRRIRRVSAIHPGIVVAALPEYHRHVDGRALDDVGHEVLTQAATDPLAHPAAAAAPDAC